MLVNNKDNKDNINIDSIDITKYPTSELIKDYWHIVETESDSISVDYGSDLDISKYKSGFLRYKPNGMIDNNNSNNVNSNNLNNNSSVFDIKNNNINNKFTPFNSFYISNEGKTLYTNNWYTKTGWNLNNLPNVEGSLLRHICTPINGVNVPWLYVGMLFSTFCWHTEDNYLNSINFNHYGDAKIWYGIPGSSATEFEKVAKEHFPLSFKESPDLLHAMNTQISPGLLQSNNIPIYKIIHEAGTFVLTWPKAYHGGFSSGFNIGEAVNFAIGDWLLKGSEADENYRALCRKSVFSHTRLLFVLAHHMNDITSKIHRSM